MKRVLLIICLFISISLQAQFNNRLTENIGSIKLGTGYVQDFPGLGGYGILGELSLHMNDRLEGAIGIKRMSMVGTPRTKTVEEFTKATTIDFTFFYVPLRTESHVVRLGIGYAYSFYSIRRSYPVISGTGSEKQTNWPIQNNKSKTSGVSVIGEYEYLINNSNLSVGMRVALYKAYDRVSYIGPFIGYRL